ncbi:hypothetical protein T10_12344 [Trichinella papuae]|uniref:Uncharacterized protein n=1 Tax=Trichinella papuae TaxID=268474 RepID=A0A0V1MXQ3_9BILA|nr:hypothetical protein T10_12344 [Trichinella papuae]
MAKRMYTSSLRMQSLRRSWRRTEGGKEKMLPPNNNAIAFWRLWKNESSSVDQRKHQQLRLLSKK